MTLDLTSNITLTSDLNVFFKSHELDVILTEVFCLPFFLRPTMILTAKDIAPNSSFKEEFILARLNAILAIKPECILDDKVVSYASCFQLKLDNVQKNWSNRGEMVKGLLKSDDEVILLGGSLPQTFSAAMYLVEEGIKVRAYGLDKAANL
jgi:hypothetical protein